MSVPASPTLGIVDDLISAVVAAGIGAWDPNGIYKEGQYGFVIGALPSTPSAVIGVNAYPVSVDVEPGTDIQGVQFRIRTGSRDPRPAYGITDGLMDTLHGVSDLMLGGFHVPLIWRNSLGDLGLDESGRYEVTDNYYMYVDRRSTTD